MRDSWWNRASIGWTASHMDWHRRYLQQASWTRGLRDYLLKEAGIQRAERVLEVGCGTGAILIELAKQAVQGPARPPGVYGLDIRAEALSSASKYAPTTILTCGDAHRLPFSGGSFDLTCCHFLLLWVSDPLSAIREMRRVTRPGGHVLGLAEPDYTRRVDHPAALAEVGQLQTLALREQGADPSIGGRVAELFYRAGLKIVETGTIAQRDLGAHDESESQAEWAVLRSDLEGHLSLAELDRLEKLDLEAQRSGERTLLVPTFFVHAQV